MSSGCSPSLVLIFNPFVEPGVGIVFVVEFVDAECGIELVVIWSGETIRLGLVGC